MELGIAVVGGLVGGTIAAIIGGIVTLKVQGRQHTHEAAMAQEARLQDRRARAYVRILEYAYDLSLWAERTEPMIGPKPDPPAPLPDAEMVKLNALTAAHASPEVLAIVFELRSAAQAVQAGIWQVADERESPHASKSGAWRVLTEARKMFVVALDHLGARINVELAGRTAD